MKTLGIVGGALIAVLLLTGCARTSDSTDEPAESVTEAEPAAPTVACLAHATDLGSRIAEGANDLPITPIATAVVEAPGFADAYLVAMEFTFEGAERSEVGVWAMNEIDGSMSMILSVDGFAQNFTVWPNTANGEELSAAEPGVEDVKSCLAEG